MKAILFVVASMLACAPARETSRPVTMEEIHSAETPTQRVLSAPAQLLSPEKAGIRIEKRSPRWFGIDYPVTCYVMNMKPLHAYWYGVGGEQASAMGVLIANVPVGRVTIEEVKSECR